MSDETLFLLSPASTGGKRAEILLRAKAQFDLAMRLRTSGAPLGEVFSFLSGLYFRGKLAYAERFGTGIKPHVITSTSGLVPADTMIGHAHLNSFASGDISEQNARYTVPLVASLEKLLDERPPTRVVLLGSIATKKYCSPLMSVLGERLLFPVDFIGRGDMSRGGLLLRAVDTGQPLEYAAVSAIETRRGTRPPKLSPRRAQTTAA